MTRRSLPFKRSTAINRTWRAVTFTATAMLAATALPIFAVPAHADAAPFAVLSADPISDFTEFKSLPTTATQIVTVTGQPDFTEALQIAVPNDPNSPGLDGEYEITLGTPTAAAVTAGDAMVATVWARSVQPRVGGDTGNVHMVFETDGNPYTKSMNVALQFGADWQKFQFPFRAAVSHPAAGAHVNFWLGYGVQTFQIAGLSVTDLGPGNPAGYPQVTYEGRAANAPWRAAANNRINQYRKGDLTVSVVDTSGQPVNGATVRASQQKSAFDFGLAADAARLLGDPSGGITASETAKYQDVTLSLFNTISLGNNLKWNHWENQTERDTLTYPALQWAREHGLTIRAHNLVWPSFGNMPTDVASLANNPDALRTRIREHVTDEASALSGLVDEIDVVNEPYSEHAVQDRLGQQEINAWFELAHQAAPDARLALNDYGILENGGGEGRHRDHVYNLLASMKAAGTPVDVIGLESHFNGLQLTSPDQLMSIVDTFAALGVKVGVTEFDVATDDLQLQADYTRDFMTAMFSNPQVTEIANFGVWAKNIYNPLVALYNPDWSPKPNALVWQDLINRQWHTDVAGTTSGQGRFGVRGFQGDYLVTVTIGGISKQVKVSMPSTAGASVTVIADGIAISPATMPANPIGDGDFETATQGWNPLGTGPATTTDAHSGSGAVALAPGSGVTQTVYGLANGTSYLLSGWAKLSGPGTQCYIGIRGGVTANKPTFQYELSYADERSYTQKLLAFTPPTATTWTQAFVWSNPNPTPTTCAADDIRITPTSGTPPPAQGPPAITPYLPTPSTLLNGTVENQASTNGWYCLGSCLLKTAPSTPHTGTGVLSVSARQAAFAGPAQGVDLPSNGGLYNSSAWLRLAEPGTDTGMVSLKLTTSTGTSTFRFGNATITGDGWTRVGASNVKVSWSGTLTKAEWWISTATGAANLLVDDASFAPMAGTVTGRDLLVNGDGEQGNANWYCLAPCAAQAATDRVHGGATAIRTANRSDSLAGPTEGVAVTNGAQYKTSAWLRLVDGSPATTAEAKLKLTLSNGTAVTIPMASAPVTAGGWTLLSANNVPVSWTGTLTKAEWWISTTTGTDDFYVDDAALQPAGTEQTAFNPVQPTAACVVNNHNTTFTAYFGYSNANNFYLPVPVGGSNTFSPGAADRGQTGYFLPYQRPKRVAVTWDGTPLTWQLNGISQTATTNSPAC